MTILYCLKKPKNLYFQRFSDFSSFLKRFNLHVEAAEKLYFLYVLEQLFIFYLICRQEETRTRYSISYASCFTSDVLLFTRPESGHVLVLWWDARWVPHIKLRDISTSRFSSNGWEDVLDSHLNSDVVILALFLLVFSALINIEFKFLVCIKMYHIQRI